MNVLIKYAVITVLLSIPVTVYLVSYLANSKSNSGVKIKATVSPHIHSTRVTKSTDFKEFTATSSSITTVSFEHTQSNQEKAFSANYFTGQFQSTEHDSEQVKPNKYENIESKEQPNNLSEVSKA